MQVATSYKTVMLATSRLYLTAILKPWILLKVIFLAYFNMSLAKQALFCKQTSLLMQIVHLQKSAYYINIMAFLSFHTSAVLLFMAQRSLQSVRIGRSLTYAVSNSGGDRDDPGGGSSAGTEFLQPVDIHDAQGDSSAHRQHVDRCRAEDNNPSPPAVWSCSHHGRTDR